MNHSHFGATESIASAGSWGVDCCDAIVNIERDSLCRRRRDKLRSNRTWALVRVGGGFGSMLALIEAVIDFSLNDLLKKSLVE